MCKIIPVMLTVATVLLPCFAYASDNSVFGFPLGVPLTISECKKTAIGSTVVYKDYDTTSTCFEFRDPNSNIESGDTFTDKIIIVFPQSEIPSIIMPRFMISGQVIDGKLESIEFDTSGHSGQDRVLDMLKKKYGKPTSLRHQKVQNRMGATFKAFDAVWKFPDLTVVFLSVIDTLDSGTVNIDTKKGLKYRNEQQKETLKDKLPL